MELINNYFEMLFQLIIIYQCLSIALLRVHQLINIPVSEVAVFLVTEICVVDGKRFLP